MFPCVCPVIDHRYAKNIFNTLGCISSRPTFLFLPHFDVIRDLLLNRCMATWNVLANIDGECDETYLFEWKFQLSEGAQYNLFSFCVFVATASL